MKRYCVICGSADESSNRNVAAFGIGREGEKSPLICDFSSQKRTEEIVRFLNRNEVSSRHFWDVVEDFLI